MKSIQTIRSLVLLAMLAVGAVSCQKEEFTATGSDAPQGTPLTISVTDGGYASGDPRTRATENGYITEFTAGDKIGLYVVKPDNSYAYENVVLTLADIGGGNLAWQAPSGTNLYYEGATAKYFAYYPYQQSVTGSLAPSAATAAGFFADVVSQWSPATNQSTHALYTAQDLMVGSGTVSKQADAYTLSFTMTHAMALVVIETPTTKYTFTNNTPTISDYYIPAPNTTFYGFTPYNPSVGTYRYLVKPTQHGASDLMGSYTGVGDKTKEYAVSPNGINPANYACYKVDGGITQKSHTLQMGDFYLKDGSLLSKDVTSLSDEQKASCLGIVYWVGDITGDDPLLKRDKPGCTHGLVVALQDAGGKSFWSSRDEDVTVEWLAKQGTTYGITSLKEQNKMQGYANTVALKAYNASSNVQTNANLKVLPIEAITTTYASAHPAPASSSGWYLPSIMELKYVCWGQGNGESIAGRDFLNAQLGKVSGASLQSDYYWSSTELGNRWAWYLSFRVGNVNHLDKNLNSCGVRAVAAF